MNQKHSSGYVMIVVLLAVAILVLLYSIQMKTFFPDSGGSPGPKVYRPWHDENLIVQDSKNIPLPDSPKPYLEDGFTVKADVTRGEKNRGIAEIKFGAYGIVTGTWKSSYTYNIRRYTYKAAFEGNIVTDKTFKDREGNKDKSKLFFITKGKYTHTTEYTETNRSSASNGTIYVTGWLNTDYTVNGTITIRKDEDFSARYELAGARETDF